MSPSALIVDDSLTVRMDLKEAFEAAGFVARLSATVSEAREAIAHEVFDVLVLDVILPDGDGVDFLAEVRNGLRTPTIPVMLLSTEAEVRDRVRGLKTGADEYIGKPYDTAYVVARAKELIRKQRVQPTPDARTTVLVIDDSVTFREGLKEALEATGYAVTTAGTGEEGLRVAADVRPAAVVVDGMLPGIDGATVVRRLRLDAVLRGTPCLLLTASEERDAELRALDSGADAFVRKDEDIGVILARLAAILRSAAAPPRSDAPRSLLGPKKVLAVDDSPTYLHALADTLRAEGHDVVLAGSGEEALAVLSVQPVDCILLDLMMPGLGGEETCRRVKAAPSIRDTPLIMLTALEDREAIIRGLGAGADDFIAKSSDLAVLKARVLAQIRRKQFEDENRHIREQLVRRETEARFQRLIHSNIIGIMIGDLTGGLADANDAFLDMLGYSRAELEGGKLRSDALTPSQWHKRDEAAIEQLRSSGSVRPYEKEYLRKDGRTQPILFGAAALEGTETYVGFVLDRTEQKVAEEKLKGFAAALEGANRELESFSYSVAHDLRAPLRSIDGFSQALLEDHSDRLDEEGRKYLRFVRESAQHMAQLIDDLLSLSRVTRSELQREGVDLSALARAAITRLQRSQPDRRVEVVIQEGLRCEGDCRLLTVALDNLFGNAWKFTGKRDEARIEFGSTSNGDTAVYFVRDNGAGFDMAFASKLFGVFQRLHAAAEFEGTGIGLATVRRVISRHQGRVWAEGEVNRGATFFFTLNEKERVA